MPMPATHCSQNKTKNAPTNSGVTVEMGTLCANDSRLMLANTYYAN